MKQPQNIAAVSNLHPDFMGFIFYKGSKRYVGKGLDLVGLPKSISKVGVFVNQSINEIQQIATRHKLDYLQLHGSESVNLCDQLKDEGFKIIKAFGVDSNFDFNLTRSFNSVVDLFLFDTKSNGYGGSGNTFDWTLLQNYTLEKPYLLSGGIGPQHIKEIKTLGGPIYGIDINSAVELRPGLKNLDKIRMIQSII